MCAGLSPKDTSSFYVIIAIETLKCTYAGDGRTIRSKLVQLDGQRRDKIFEQLVPIPSARSVETGVPVGQWYYSKDARTEKSSRRGCL